MSEKDKCPRCGKNGVVVKVFGRTTKAGIPPNQGAVEDNKCGLCGWYSIRKSCGHRYQLIELSTRKGVEKFPMNCPSDDCNPEQGKGITESTTRYSFSQEDGEWVEVTKNDDNRDRYNKKKWKGGIG